MQGKPDGFETVRKIRNDLQKIWTVFTPFRKWNMIWKNPEGCGTVRKMENDLAKSEQL